MKPIRALSIGLSCVLLAISPPHTTLYGYGPMTSDRERTDEQTYLDTPSSAAALEDATLIAGKPHYAGSSGDYQLAVAMRDKLASYGFTASIETLTARVDTPKKLGLALVPAGTASGPSGPNLSHLSIAARLRYQQQHAPPKPKKPKKGKKGAQPAPVPSMAASPAPTIAPVVSFDLRELPVTADPDTANPAVGLPFVAGSADGNVTAPLVYAARGLEADYAALAAHTVDVHGAVVLIRYGADQPGILVRRAQAHGAVGAVLYDDPADQAGAGRGGTYPNGPGRPLTSVQRSTVGEGVTIPVLAVSAITARTMLAALHGPSAPPPWTGAMGVNYPFDRGILVHLTVELTRKNVTLWNTIGVLPGQRQDQSVLIGAHRDAWVYGAGDDGSGLVTELETARGLGYLAKGGWQPGRTIVVAGWDGEEIGGYGSIAYVKAHADQVQRIIAYLDAEQNVTGAHFGADSTAPIRSTVSEATQIVPDPLRPGTSVFDTWFMASRLMGTSGMPAIALAGNDRLTALFGDGTPSMTAGFTGTFGVYHSSYDTLRFATTFSDPDFALHRTAAQLYGVIAMRLADADVLPYRFSAYVAPMQQALRALQAQARGNKLTIDSRSLASAIARFSASAARYDAATVNLKTDAASASALEAARVLDLTAYGSDGYAAVSFPEIARGLRQSQAATDIAAARVRTTIEHAADLLAL